MKNNSKRILCCCAIAFAMCALQSQAGLVKLNFNGTASDQNHGARVDTVTLGNLNGVVTASSDTGVGTPTVPAASENTLTAAGGLSGTIGLDFAAISYGAGSNFFDPDTWTGGAPPNNWDTALYGGDGFGWGVYSSGSDQNGKIEFGEVLFMTVDLSNLSMPASYEVVMTAGTFAFDDGIKGDLWMRNFDVSTGTSGAGTQLVNNQRYTNFSEDLVLKDGDVLAFMSGASAKEGDGLGTALEILRIDVIPEPATLGMVSFGVAMLLVYRRRFC